MSETSRGCILVVDDDDDIRAMLQKQLTREGYDTLIAENGQKAIELIESLEVDVVVSDLMMAPISGLELIKTLRQRNFFQPIIILTGFATQDAAIEALRLGAFDFLTKPCDVDKFSDVVLRAFQIAISQKNLDSQISKEKIPLSDEEKMAEMQILRIRALRESYQSFSKTTGEQNKASPKIQKMFINESVSQLSLCKKSMYKLDDVDLRTDHLVYLLRVTESIKSAAQTVKSSEVVTFCQTLEQVLSILHVKPPLTDSIAIEIISRAVEILCDRISILESHTPDEFIDMQGKLDFLHKTLKKSV